MYHPTADDTQAMFDKIRSLTLFETLDDDAIRQLLPHFHEAHFDKQTVIFHEADLPSESGSRIYFVMQGCVKLVKYSTDGESTIVRMVTQGEFMGITGALTNFPLPFSAEALTDTTLLYLDKEHFIQLIMDYPKVALNIMIAMGEMLWFIYETHNQVVKKTESRVSKILMYHFLRDGYEETSEGKVLQINLPHDYIASMTGIAYEESVRIISRLKKEHRCINYLRGGKIIVLNEEKLRELAQSDDLCIPHVTSINAQ